MDKIESHKTARLGQVRGPVQNEAMTMSQAQAFDLLKSVPFTLHVGGTLNFSLPSLAMRLLFCESINLPNNERQWTARMDPEDVRTRNQAIKRLTWDGARYALRYPVYTQKGDKVWVKEMGERLTGDGDVPLQVTGVILNVSEEQNRLDTAEYRATHDELSGLFNRALFTRAVNMVGALMKRRQETAAVLRLRIINIEDINSVYGYEIGDRIIRQIGERLKQSIRAPDIISRIEDADFGLCLVDSEAQALDRLMPRLQTALNETPYATPHGGLYAEFAVSATFLGQDTFDAEEAIEQTKSVFAARPNLQGWNIGYYEPDMAAHSISRSRAEITENDILTALNDRRVSLAYQPIIDAKTRDLHHYECLLRLRRNDGEIVSAGRFIMAAERLGLVNLLDRRALEIGAQALQDNPELHIALNVSAGTLRDEQSASEYIKALKALGPNAARVTIELTETLALDDPAMASLFSVELRKLGCAFAIDDFGSGYTTFRNLMAIEADTIKIDGSFIQDIATEPHKQTFVRMMVDLAQTFSVKTVAEMVDSHADADLLRRLGVDYLQGYMFGIPSAAPAWQRQAS
ncbi:MAG: GGDEF and EAL domain-containing protein [Litorimonas sp.]